MKNLILIIRKVIQQAKYNVLYRFNHSKKPNN